MRQHGEEVIQHMVAIGHGDEATVRPRIEAGVAGAEAFLLNDGLPVRSRAGLLFVESYRDLPLLSWPRRLIDSFVELEQAMLLFRTHHARMVERMIGRRMGTGVQAAWTTLTPRQSTGSSLTFGPYGRF